MAITVPLRVSSDKRYLLGEGGAPTFLRGDSNPTAHVNLSQTDRIRYLDFLVSNGWNAFWLMFMVKPNAPFRAVNTTAESNFDGVLPFSTTSKVSTLNSTYVNDVAAFVEAARVRNIYVQLYPWYNGFAGGPSEGYGDKLDDGTNSAAELQQYGTDLATTLTHPNLLWGFSGDWTMPATGNIRANFKKIMTGIKAVETSLTTRLWFSELDNPSTIATDQPGFTFGPDPLSFDHNIMSYYGIGPSQNGCTQSTGRGAWDVGSGPTMIQEIAYLNNGWNSYKTRAPVRYLRMRAICGGSNAGANYGDDHRFFGTVSTFNGTLTDASSMDASRLNQLVTGLPMHLLRPTGTAAGRIGRTLVVSGGGALDSDTEIVASQTSDGTLLLAYWPGTLAGATSASLDLRSMAPRALRASFWDPTNAKVTYVSGGSYAFDNTMSSQSFTPPSANSAGDTDFLLMVEAAPYSQKIGPSYRSPATGPSGTGGSRLCSG